MPSLVVVVYPTETTASAAVEEVHRVASDLVVGEDAAAVICCDREENLHVTTRYSQATKEVPRSVFWALLFAGLFLDWTFATRDPALGPLLASVHGVTPDRTYEIQLRGLLQPGTSALFLIVDDSAPSDAFQFLDRFGGTSLRARMVGDGRL